MMHSVSPLAIELGHVTLGTRIRQFHELSMQSHVNDVWSGLSHLASLTMRDVLDYPDKPWDWSELSMNKNITMRDVLDHPDKPWSVNDLAANPYVIRPMTDEIVDYVRKRYAAFVISSAAYEAWTNPNSYLCKRRLQREFDMLLC